MPEPERETVSFGKRHSHDTKTKIGEIISKVQLGENNSQYIDGRSFFPYCHKFNPARKRAVRDFFNNQCICCGKHKDENIVNKSSINLDVHHIDHDKEQGCNGKPFNLVPFCRSCHTKEGNNQEEYRDYVNKTMDAGFEWGIWSRREYELKVMYPE